MSTIEVKYRIKKVKVDGVYKFLPFRRKSFLGFGKWIVDPDWASVVRTDAEEKYLGLDTDSTLTLCRAFVSKRDGSDVKNKFYEEQ
jgi:hypothetical protein